MKKTLVMVILGLCWLSSSVLAQEGKITNAMIYQKLIELEKRQIEFEKRQAMLEAKFDQMQRYMDGRFTDIIHFLYMLTAFLVGIMGWAYWDRTDAPLFVGQRKKL